MTAAVQISSEGTFVSLRAMAASQHRADPGCIEGVFKPGSSGSTVSGAWSCSIWRVGSSTASPKPTLAWPCFETSCTMRTPTPPSSLAALRRAHRLRHTAWPKSDDPIYAPALARLERQPPKHRSSQTPGPRPAARSVASGLVAAPAKSGRKTTNLRASGAAPRWLGLARHPAGHPRTARRAMVRPAGSRQARWPWGALGRPARRKRARATADWRGMGLSSPSRIKRFGHVPNPPIKRQFRSVNATTSAPGTTLNPSSPHGTSQLNPALATQWG